MLQTLFLLSIFALYQEHGKSTCTINNIDGLATMKITQSEMARRTIGAGLLCIGAICILWGDQNNNLAVMKFGKTTAAFGIVLYFLGRIGRVLKK